MSPPPSSPRPPRTSGVGPGRGGGRRPSPRSRAARFGGLRPGRALWFAALGLLRRPGTAVAAVATLGLGLVVTVTLLGVGHGMLRPLPVPEGSEIVRIDVLDSRGEPVSPTARLLAAWEEGSPRLEGVEPFRVAPVDLAGDGRAALRRSSAALTPGAFRLLGVRPVRGRLPTASPEDAGAVLMSEALAEGWLGGAAEAVGATLRLNGRPHTVVGVMPSTFGFPYAESLWTVLDPSEEASLEGAELFGRLADGVSEEAAGTALETALPRDAAGVGPGAPARVAVRSFVGGRGQSGELMALAGLGVLVAVLLLVAAANVSTLLTVRATERAGSLAVHAALGAPRLQIALQLLLEAAWIAAAGGVLGVLGGYALLEWIEGALSVHWGYHWMRMEVDPAVLGWTAGVVVITAVLAGTAPALRAMRTDLRGVLAGGRSGDRGSESHAVGRWLVGGQLALSTTGLLAAAFLGLGVLRMGDLTRGLPLDRVAVARVPLGPAAADDGEARAVLVRSLREALEAIPGAEAASVSGGTPGFGGARTAVAGPDLAPDAPASVAWTTADEGYFDVYGLDVLRGRGIAAGDVPGADRVVVVNTTFVDRFLRGAEPLGSSLRLAGVHGEGEVSVVGVVEDPFGERPETASPQLYVPLAQAPPEGVVLSVRAGNPGGLAPLVAEAVRGVHPDLPVEDVQSLRAFMDYLVRIPRTVGRFGVLGGLGVVIVAAVGLYGVLAFRVRRRLPELGIRMALGASRGRIVGEVLAAGLRVMLPGLGVGMVLGALVTPLLAAFLFGLRPAAPLVYAGVVVGMLAVGLLAALAPALRAARSDPLAVLRAE